MTDGIKFIFKTLIKVPIFIFVSYLILNIFMFAYTYFRMLGISYVVMQTAAENNYLPSHELTRLNETLTDFATDTGSFVVNARILTNDSDLGGADEKYNPDVTEATTKRQYGTPVRVGIIYEYRFIWPLMPYDEAEGKTIETGEGEIGGWYGTGDVSKGINVVRIDYTIPGLKYYPDLGRSNIR